MDTVMIGADGMLSAEYFQPVALNAPQGISDSMVLAQFKTNRMFSVTIGAEWVVITADTQVTAANGNVYGLRFVDGIPMPQATPATARRGCSAN